MTTDRTGHWPKRAQRWRPARCGVGCLGWPFVGPGRVPVIFDHEGVSQVLGDLAERPSA
ncbi:MAG TPA: hypothetical protein VMV69_01805 [Pirellulales bacterium]|nr:hypothetical protein [Pirellulales bacterium]